MIDPQVPSIDVKQQVPIRTLREINYRQSADFVPILRHLRCSLLVSTYAAGKVVTIGTDDAGLRLSFYNFEQAMGVAVSPKWLAVGSRHQIWLLNNGNELAQQIEPSGQHDLCYLVRKSFFTNNIHVHEMSWGGNELWVVNTLFSCLCTLDDNYSFVPRWRPPFITELAAQDRCHLNGLAMQDGMPKYVTAMSQTNVAAGWRENKATTGVVVEVTTNEIVCHGLCMPHSPRIAGNQLWVLNSGEGALSRVDVATGKCETVEKVPGYTRGLALCGQFAFVGMSKIRETSVFGGVPIAEKRDELKCGIVAIDLTTGKSVAYLEFETGVDEIFDVQVIAGRTSPTLAGPYPEQDETKPIWVVPNSKLS